MLSRIVENDTPDDNCHTRHEEEEEDWCEAYHRAWDEEIAEKLWEAENDEAKIIASLKKELFPNPPITDPTSNQIIIAANNLKCRGLSSDDIARILNGFYNADEHEAFRDFISDMKTEEKIISNFNLIMICIAKKNVDNLGL